MSNRHYQEIKCSFKIPSCNPFRQVIKTYKSGSSFYRTYSDGWCEQGGYWSPVAVNQTNNSRDLLLSFANSDYNCIIQPYGSSFSEYGANYVVKREASKVFISGYGTGSNKGFLWRACGYISTPAQNNIKQIIKY